MIELLERALTPLEGKALPTPTKGAPDLYGERGQARRRIANRNAARHVEAYGGLEAIDWVSDCVELYAQSASNAAYYFERNGKRLYREGEDAPDAYNGRAPRDLVNLFERPNDMQDYTELIELAVIDLLLAGEFLWWMVNPDPDGKPAALYRLPPTSIEVVPGPVAPRAYLYNPPGGGDEVRLAPESVLHVKRPNPHDPWRGLGVIAGGPRVYDLELALTEAGANYYERGTRTSGVLETDRNVPPNVVTKLKREFAGMFAGAHNAGRVPILERGLRFRPVSGSATDAQLVEVGKWSRDRIGAAFGVPPILLGDLSGADRQAVREAKRIFANDRARPFFNRMQSMISRGLTQAWDVDFCIDYQYVMPIEDKYDLATSLATLPGVKVVELRDAVELPPLGDERDEIVLNLPGMDREDGGHPDAPIGEEAGRPPNPENTKPFPKPGAALPASADAAKAVLDTIERARAALSSEE